MSIPLAALGRLNTHARAWQGQRQRDAIYSYKKLAAIILAVGGTPPVCKRHREGPEKAGHPKDPPPPAMLTPAIQRWLDRHERIQVIR